MSRSKSLIFFIASMVIFGTNGLLVANISLGSAEIVLMRTFLGSLFLLAVVLVKRSFSFADLKADLIPATIGGAALGLNWVLLFSAYRSAGVGLSTLTYYCGPIIVLALSPVLFREKLTWNKLLAIAAVAVGMFCITGDIKPGSDVQTGILFGGGAALLYASLIVANKRVKRLSGLNCAMYELIVAFFVVLIYLLASNVKLPVIPAAEDIVWVLAIGLVNTGLAYYLYFSSLQKLRGQEAAILSYIDPLVAVIVSFAVFREPITPLQLVGGALILGFTLWNELRGTKKKEM